MDGVLVNFQTGIDNLEPKIRNKFKDNIDEAPNIFSLMSPINGAIESFQTISEKYDTYILSTAPWNNPSAWSDKVKWVQKYLKTNAYKRLILSHNKNLNYGDYLIDDRTANGAKDFKGKHIHFGSKDFPDWDSILDFLM